jgi:hypothetical protein
MASQQNTVNLPTVPPFKSNIINKNATNIFDLPNGDFGNPDAIIAHAKLAYDKVSGKVERVAPLAINAFQKYFAGYLNVANIFERAAYNDYLLNVSKDFIDVQDIPADLYPEAEKLGQYTGYHARLLSGLITKLGAGYVFKVTDRNGGIVDMNVKFIWSIDAPSKLDFLNNSAIVSHVLKGEAAKDGNIFIAYEKDIIDAIVTKIGTKLNTILSGIEVLPTEYVLTINMFSILSNVTIGTDGNMYFLSIMNIQGMTAIVKDTKFVEGLARIATSTLEILSTYNGY